MSNVKCEDGFDLVLGKKKLVEKDGAMLLHTKLV